MVGDDVVVVGLVGVAHVGKTPHCTAQVDSSHSRAETECGDKVEWIVEGNPLWRIDLVAD